MGTNATPDLYGYDEFIEQYLGDLTPMQRLKGLAPEERLKGLAPEERLKDLTEAEQVLALRSICCGSCPTTTSPRSRPMCRRRSMHAEGPEADVEIRGYRLATFADTRAAAPTQRRDRLILAASISSARSPSRSVV
jgi:hypothetical protein